MPRSQNLVGSKFNCLNYILLYAERQMPFNLNEMDIERKLFALAIWIWVGTLHQIQPETQRIKLKYKCFYASSQHLFWLWKLTSPMAATTASVPRYNTLVQLVHYTLSSFSHKSSHLTFCINHQRWWVIVTPVAQGISPLLLPKTHREKKWWVYPKT